MTLYYANGSPQTDLNGQDLRAAMVETLQRLEPRRKVLALPPDHTRSNSMAGPLCRLAYEYFGDRLTDVMSTLGTHAPMRTEQLDRMFPAVPKRLIRVHDWRRDVVTIGTVPAEFVADATEGVYRKPWPAQLNRLVWQGGHDLILSIGQIVPHEVVGMAGYNKNLFVGAGGQEGINESHFIGAAYGMERMMGRADTPLRRILNYAQDQFCGHLPVVFVLTVVGPREDGEETGTGSEPHCVDSAESASREVPVPLSSTLAVRGLFIGDDVECFKRAAALSLQVNFTVLDRPPRKIVVYLDADEFHSTWLGNKAIYRTRMAIADGGELVILAPGVAAFGEDREIDRLIRKYGYRTTPEVMRFIEQSEDLPKNLSAAAHLIHGSSEGRFTITYCPGKLTREEIESVGYNHADLETMLRCYDPKRLHEGWNELSDGERIYFIGNPALGLWASRERLGEG
ncbi:MAG: lactate racemase domain-containing protein [Pirellulales bacterium]|nr:lactate racemase domain-containing protein [Pirellulales bacterium]